MGEQKTALGLLLIFCFTVVSVSQYVTLKGQETLNLTIKPDGSVVPATDLLERNGTTYTLKGDIFGTIIVQKNGIIIDGKGYTLQGGKEVSVRAVYLVGPDLSHPSCRDVLVKNLRIFNFYDGIFAVGSSNISIIGNALENAGIHFLGGANITGNLVKFNNFTDAGVFIDYNKGGLDVITENNFINGWVIVGLSDVPIVEKNYWSDYKGKDNNGDGIGDTPHTSSIILDEKVQDNYPLIEPIVIPEFHDEKGETEPFPTLLVIAVTVTIVTGVAGCLLIIYSRNADNQTTKKLEQPRMASLSTV
jgi:hypothetical protein